MAKLIAWLFVAGKLGKLLTQIKLALSGNLEGQPYYEVPLGTRIHYSVMYLGLAAFLAVMSYDLHEMIGRY
jgi:hypothetical protein